MHKHFQSKCFVYVTDVFLPEILMWEYVKGGLINISKYWLTFLVGRHKMVTSIEQVVYFKKTN